MTRSLESHTQLRHLDQAQVFVARDETHDDQRIMTIGHGQARVVLFATPATLRRLLNDALALLDAIDANNTSDEAEVEK